jgi:hypothetical protein
MADPFQPKFVDLVRNTTTTTGTGNFVLGPAVSGYTSFTAACQVGDSFYYSTIGIDKPQEREVGRGTLLSGGIISRDPVSGAKTNFTNGTKSIALIAAAEWYQAAQQLMAVITPFGQTLASASSAALARGTLGLGVASVLDSDGDATLSANSDSKVPTQKAVKAYVDSRQSSGSLLATNNLSDVASASTARTNLGIGSAGLETVSRFSAARIAFSAGQAQKEFFHDEALQTAPQEPQSLPADHHPRAAALEREVLSQSLGVRCSHCHVDEEGRCRPSTSPRMRRRKSGPPGRCCRWSTRSTARNSASRTSPTPR